MGRHKKEDAEAAYRCSFCGKAVYISDDGWVDPCQECWRGVRALLDRVGDQMAEVKEQLYGLTVPIK